MKGIEMYLTKETLVKDKEEYVQKLQRILKWWKENVHVLADFDWTLTQWNTTSWEKIPSLISILRDEKYLIPWYSQEAKKLFAHYYPIEQNKKLSHAEKCEKMEERREKHSQLLIKSGLNKKDIKKASTSLRIRFRKYMKEVVNILENKWIPLIILSASWLWKYAIEQTIKYHDIHYSDNITVISNDFHRDKKWNAIESIKPHIHSLNKNECEIKNNPAYKNIKERKNIILLWNNIWDTAMAEWYEYDTILKIGFSNNIKDNTNETKEFLKHYDIVIPNDWSMEYILKTIQLIN